MSTGLSLGAVVDDTGSVHLDSSWLPVLLKVCRPLLCVVSANCRVFNLLHLSTSRSGSLFILASSIAKSLQCLISVLMQGRGWWCFLGSLVQSCCWEGGTPSLPAGCVPKVISTTLGLPLLTASVLARSALLRKL